MVSCLLNQLTFFFFLASDMFFFSKNHFYIAGVGEMFRHFGQTWNLSPIFQNKRQKLYNIDCTRYRNLSGNRPRYDLRPWHFPPFLRYRKIQENLWLCEAKLAHDNFINIFSNQKETCAVDSKAILTTTMTRQSWSIMFSMHCQIFLRRERNTNKFEESKLRQQSNCP